MEVLDEAQISSDYILHIENLRVHFFTFDGVVKALDGIDLDIRKGESFGLVGETGCGKSVTVRSVLRLIEEPGKIVDGEILFNGIDILKEPIEQIRKIRGKKISMVFQDPMTFLNPVIRVGDQVGEVYLLHGDVPEAALNSKGKIDKNKLKKEIKKKVLEIFQLVRLPDVEELYSRYPHELSGGMRQRVMIAMSIASTPDILIADEATTALDVTIQAQILELLQQLKEELKTTLIFVTHNLGIIAEMCDRVAIFYGGQVVEVAKTKEIFGNAIHPYTEGLLKAIPLLHKPKKELDAIRGVVPNLVNPPSGCRFNPRCHLVEDQCSIKKPKLVELIPDHYVACFVRERELG